MTASPLGRVVDVAQPGRHLAKDRGFLVVAEKGTELGRVPLDDVMAVLATHQATTTSCVLLSELAERGIPFVVCGGNFAPTGLIWPLAGHHAQQRRMEAQAAAPTALKAELWRQVVTAKVRAQGRTLAALGRKAGAFASLAEKVAPGDPANIEARAARRYWPLVFGRDFRRDADGGGPNRMLNYGYAVLRAATARALAGAGLHPGLGIFHRHPFNPMPLADDVMEPFRPVVDLETARIIQDLGPEVTTDAKKRLTALLQLDLPTKAGTTPLATCLHRLAGSLADAFQNGTAVLTIPVQEPPDAETIAHPT
jgi:CRISPR-associated protein Cas1